MHLTIVTGNLGRDPEFKKFDNGGCVANFSVGVTERGLKLDNGTEISPHTEWYRCIPILQKGTPRANPMPETYTGIYR